MPRPYSERISRRTIAMALIPLAVLFVGKGAMLALGVDDSRWFAFGLVFCSFFAFMILGTRLWKSLDDIVRQGHAASVYWGSFGGIAITACLIVATGLNRSEFALGVATLLVMQLVCSMLVYAGWSLKGLGLGFRSAK